MTAEVAALAMFGVRSIRSSSDTGKSQLLLAAELPSCCTSKGNCMILLPVGEDSKSIMQFALIWMVILPMLPNRTYGPFNVIDPRQIWLMVVLVVEIGLGGYIG